MKKLFAIFLSIVYLVLSSGFAKQVHLCKGTLSKQVSLANITPDSRLPCPLCMDKERGLSKKKKNCCKIDIQIFKTDKASSKQAGFDFSIKVLGEAIPNSIWGTVFDKLSVFHVPNFPIYSSSKISLSSNPLYIFHCLYRI